MGKRKNAISELEGHPIFNSCTWRFDPPSIAEEEKLQKCAECYSRLDKTTEYCEHMKRFYWDNGR